MPHRSPVTAPPVRLRDLLHPPAPPHDPAAFTGFPVRVPRRRTVEVPDPVSGAPTPVAVWEYAPARPADGAAPGRAAEVTAAHAGGGTEGADAAGADAAGPGLPLLVFVHGFRGDHHGLALLADALPEFAVVSLELPGFGASAPFPDAGHTVAHHGAAVGAAVAELSPDTSPDTSPVLVAHSYGSIVAAHLVAQDPHRWAGLVLLNPIAEPALDAAGSVGARLAAVVAQGYYEVAARLPERAGLALLGAPPVVWATTAFMTRTRDRRILAYTHDQHRRYFSRFASRRMLSEAYRASTTSTVLDAAAGLTLPVLLVAGARDPLGSVAAQQALAAAITTAGGAPTLHVLDGVGHLLHYECPVDGAALIRDWMART